MHFSSTQNSGISISHAPNYALGWQFVQQSRMLIFEGAAPHFSIDLNTQSAKKGLLYLIPPLHFHFISPSQLNNFWCIDIPNHLLNESDKQLHLMLKFHPLKHLALGTEIYESLIACLKQKEYDRDLLLATIKKCFRQACTAMHLAQNRPNHSFDLATKLLQLLASRDEKLEWLSVKNLAEELHASERTLLRSCRKVFGVSIQELIQYQLLLASLFMLSHKASTTAITQELGFANQKSFTKFMKRQLKQTPKEVRAIILDRQV